MTKEITTVSTRPRISINSALNGIICRCQDRGQDDILLRVMGMNSDTFHIQPSYDGIVISDIKGLRDIQTVVNEFLAAWDAAEEET